MKKILIATLTTGLMVGVAAAETAVTLDVASAYVFRGTTVVDDLVVQPGIEVSGFGLPEKYGTISLGAWGSTAPWQDAYDNLHETDWYGVYTLPMIITNLDLYVSLTEYMYPDTSGETELGLGAAYLFDPLTIGASANFMTDDQNPLTEDQIYLDAFVSMDFDLSEKVAASVGALGSFMIQGDGNAALGLDDGFNHVEIEGALAYAINDMWSVGGSLTYIGQLDDNVLPDSAHDKGLVAMLSIGCEM